uniref:hypothetical protein n=1 Tax=Membranihabitans maritimus TaxID=2904244 RepID=UPI001F292888
RFDPELSDGDSRFVPGTDEDGEYLYIVEQDDCQDTAVLTVQNAVTEVLALDTVSLCPGGRRKIGFPSGKFSEIEWWDGSSGDSIWVEELEDIQRRVEVQFGDCRISVPVEIIIRPVS